MKYWRLLCSTAVLLAAIAGLPHVGAAPRAGVVTIRMMSDRTGSDVWFDPVGVLVAPGTSIRWIMDAHTHANVHSTAAYHPANEGHSLRIPVGAEPWDSGLMAEPGQPFEVRLTVPGTYDYYCSPHEAFGMVGRIVVGNPGGPGDLSFDYFKGRKDAVGWKSVPAAARRALPSPARIMREKVVRRGS